MVAYVSDGSEIVLADLMALAQSAQMPEKRLLAKRQQQSSRRSVFHGRGMEYAESRAYQPGDEVRHLDWRLLARTGDAYSKQFQEERDRPTWIWTDLSAPMWFGSVKLLKSVQASHLAACLGWSALQRGDAVGGVVMADNTLETRPGRGRASLMRYLHLLADPKNHWSQSPQDPLQKLQQLSRLVKTGARVHIISDFHWLSEAAVPVIRRLSRHNDVVAWQVLDQLERRAPKKNLALSFRSDHGSRLAVFSRRGNKAYDAKAALHIAQQQHMLQSAMASHQVVSASRWIDQGGLDAN